MPFVFEQPTGFQWLWAVVAAALLLWFAEASRRRAALRWADARLLPRLTGGVALARGIARPVLVVAALAALATGLADPRAGAVTEQVRRSGIDVFFVIDVSRSMLAEDVKPDRLARARQLVSDALDRMRGDRVGLIAFAGTAVIVSPLTQNFTALRLSLEELSPMASDRGGSLLGDAIRLAAESFTDEAKSGKAIVVLSDGEDMESFPVEAARDAFAQRGARTFTIGIGDPREGARIPVVEGGRRAWLMHEGREVWTKMDPRVMTEIALAGDGAFIPAGTSLVDMNEIYDQTIGSVARRDYDAESVTRASPQFQWFAGAALILLLVETLLPARRRAPRLREQMP